MRRFHWKPSKRVQIARFEDRAIVRVFGFLFVLFGSRWHLSLERGDGRRSMRRTLIDLLKRLESAIPPPPNCHHAITYAQYGAGSSWEDRLALQINKEGTFHCFFIDDGDLQQPAEELAEKIVAALVIPFPNEQFGVALGQYLPTPQSARN